MKAPIGQPPPDRSQGATASFRPSGGSNRLASGDGDPEPELRAVDLTGNTISGTELGINIYGEAEATLRDNSVCDNEINVQVRGDANADIDDSNEICEDAPAA